MKTTLKIVIAIILVIGIILFPIIGSYNKIVSFEQAASAAKSNIDTQLQRRLDLIPNLVSTVQGFADQEKEIFTDLAEARSKLAGAQTTNEQATADSELSSALSRLLVVVERYPELKSNQNFQNLSIQLEGTENRIAVARQDYNNAVTAYNSSIRRFPSNIIASIFGFEPLPLYEASAGADVAPSVDFSR